MLTDNTLTCVNSAQEGRLVHTETQCCYCALTVEVPTKYFIEVLKR